MSFLFVLIWILIFLIIILGSITIHEFGHFLALKKMKVFVHEFAIGFGPAIFKWGKGETQYTLRALPLGGYVLPASRYSSDAFPNVIVPTGRFVEDLSLSRKILFILAGITMNIIVAFLFSLTYFAIKDHLKNVASYGDFIKQSVVGFFVAFGNIFTGHNSESIVTTIDSASKQEASRWMAVVCLLIISINFNLAFFNVIPFPPLDGWRVVEFTYESATKKQIKENTKVIVTIMGIAVLVLFTIFVFISPYIHFHN